MRISLKVLQTGVLAFALTFSSIATAQHYLLGAKQVRVSQHVTRNVGIREIPVFFPQGRLYCADGELAYRKLHSQEWQRISSKDAIRLASVSVDEACAGGDPRECRQQRDRLSTLRNAIRGCF